ncbi:hypothetical protein BEWA_000540 [Theileria equi strain WA]|uniref:Signal peptide containing protein n=1 Tax=Theileria equi strain WA TaxID=1537102 RepID=L0B0I6_THEEQ|nr:hypothetical protein BEWA_000540 [Theileria equi strain WA]AFZ80649.1 hypothetical protein BEWA_000540 [Theileria equi strain WA]|eukprot:XP_004830315.1 hypothetical protein BEWA_000540 [Theileria equi strain WA]
MRLSSLLYTILFIKLVRPEKKVTFDILKPDSNKTKVNVSKYSGLESKRYTPKDGFRINKVKYGDKQLWKSRLRHSDGCKSIEVYSNEETKLLALYVVKGGATEVNCFEDVGGMCNSLPFTTFNNKFNEAKKKGSEATSAASTEDNAQTADHTSPEPKKSSTETAKESSQKVGTHSAEQVNTTISLDLFKPNASEITKIESAHRGTITKTYTPKEGHHISSVVYNKSTVWKPAEGTNEKCELAKSYSSSGEILYLDIKDNNGNAKPKYYKKNGAVWNGIPEHVFNLQLKTMKGTSVDEDSAQNDGKSHFDLQPRKDNRTNSENDSTGKSEILEEDTEPPAPSRPLTNCALDLSKPDEDEIVVNENKNYGGGVTQKDFSPKEGFKIDYILNNGTPVIKLSEGEEFRSIRLYSKRSSHILMITMKKPEGVKHQYYEKIAGDWYKLKDKSEFNVRLNAMKGS